MNRATRVVLAFLLILSIFSAVACSGERVFEHCELGIRLPRAFKEKEAREGFDLEASDGHISVGITRFSFDAVIKDGILATHTPLKFAEVYQGLIEAATVGPLRESGDIPYFIYRETTAAGEVFFMPTFYRTPYAYFVITFVSQSDITDSMLDELLGYAKSVFVNPEYI